MRSLITAQTWSDIKETKRQKTKNKISANKKFTAKTEYLNLKAPSNNAKVHSGKTVTTQVYFSLTIQHMENFLDETG